MKSLILFAALCGFSFAGTGSFRIVTSVNSANTVTLTTNLDAADPTALTFIGNYPGTFQTIPPYTAIRAPKEMSFDMSVFEWNAGANGSTGGITVKTSWLNTWANNTMGSAAFSDSTDFATASQGSLADTAIQPATYTSGLAGKEPTISSGTTSQYWRGDKTWQTFPTIPAAQVQSDWNAVSGMGVVLNKPTSWPWSSITGAPSFITGISSSDVTTALGYTPYNATNPSSYVNQAGARSSISLTTTGTGAATYNNSTGVLNIPTPSIPSVTQNDNVSRSLNTNYTVSASQRARLYYSVNISWNIAALLSGSGSAFLEYSTNGGSSWVIINQVSKSIGLLTFAGADDMNLNGEVPANALVRIRTSSTNMTVSYVRGQEIIQ